jgi:hypothetical protein
MKTKQFASLILLIGYFQIAIGQVTDAEGTLKKQTFDTIVGWKTGGVIGLNLAQTSLTHWAAGGQESFAVNGLFSVYANYKKDTKAWDNSLDIGYGLLKPGKEANFLKTDDKIDFLSKFGLQTSNKSLYYAALLNFKTQMSPGYVYPTDSTKERISDLLAPAYILGAIGLDYKPNSYFSAFAAPLTGKITIVNDKTLSDSGAFGVDRGKTIKSEFGGYIRVIYSRNDFKSAFLKNVSFTTKIDLFSNYLKDPECIDVSWETQIAFNINKYISVNLNTQLLYDNDIQSAIYKNDNVTIENWAPVIQFKEILAVGFSYKF